MPDKKLCFVIMPFREKHEEVYNHVIKPAVEESGYRCVIAKEVISSGNITRDIIEHISQADIIVADLTGQNPNVFYGCSPFIVGVFISFILTFTTNAIIKR